MPGGGPRMVITDLGCYEFRNGEMFLTSLHPGCTLEQVRNNTGWDIPISSDLKRTDEPTKEELLKFVECVSRIKTSLAVDPTETFILDRHPHAGRTRGDARELVKGDF